jgi:SAM-dependent methyltransferase
MNNTPLEDASSTPGFDATLFEHLYEAEDRHFWFRARNRVIATVVRQLTRNFLAESRVLEIGCGNGNVLRVLEQNTPHGTVIGVEPFAEAGVEHGGASRAKLFKGIFENYLFQQSSI